MPRKRGAVVVGVDKTGDLPALEASAKGAIKFATWLEKEGFTVVTITDREGAVTVSQIANAIKSFVVPGTYDQLVVYFTGHGYWKNDAELWLLTGAPADANEAVNWKETVEFAKDCGIPNVVLISDACRSVPTTPRAQRVRGSIVFPNDDIQRNRAKVDKFMAAAVGKEAFEVLIKGEKEKENAFTHCLLRAYSSPDVDMIVSVEEDGKAIDIVPNRKLGPYLRREVPDLLASINIAIEQTPDDEVTSDEKVYIGQAKAPAQQEAVQGDELELLGKKRKKARRRGKVAPPVPLREIASKVLMDALEMPLDERIVDKDAASSVPPTGSGKFDQALSSAGSTASQSAFAETGFSITGAGIVDCTVVGEAAHRILERGDGATKAGLIDVRLKRRSATVFVRFDDGSGIALAALHGYIGHVIVDGGRVVSINYMPSKQDFRYWAFANRETQLNRLRAAAAAAIRFGVFRLDDPTAAAKLATTIRVEKSIDPSLGLYAAYAYSEANDTGELSSVRSLMNDDLGVDLFDVAMLATRAKVFNFGPNIVPFCPMLTQGWNFLRMCNIKLPSVLDEAQDELARAVWTTFLPERTEAIFEAIRNGELS